MRKAYSTVVLFTLYLCFALLTPTIASAQSADCSPFSIDPGTLQAGETITVTWNAGIVDEAFFRADIFDNSESALLNCSEEACPPDDDLPVTLFTLDTAGLTSGQTYSVNLRHGDGLSTCNRTITFNVIADDEEDNFCEPRTLTGVAPGEGDQSQAFQFTGCAGSGFVGPTNPGVDPCNGNARVVIESDTDPTFADREVPIYNSGGGNSCDSDTGQFSVSSSSFPWGEYSALLYLGTGNPLGSTVGFTVLDNQGSVGEACQEVETCTSPLGVPGTRTCLGVTDRDPTTSVLYCKYDSDVCSSCNYCGDGICQVGEPEAGCPDDCALNLFPAGYLCNGGNGIDTAFGCLMFVSPIALSNQAFRIGIGIAGGIAFLLIALSGGLIATSQGDPDRLSAGKALFISSVGGLLLVIFSVFILRLFGVDVLGL